MEKIYAAVVVTYNRKKLLINCLEAIRRQKQKVDSLYIIDNLSDDGTPQILLDNGFIKKMPELNPDSNIRLESEIRSHNNEEKIQLVYIRKKKNDGGAGGFYEGLKQAVNDGFEWIWLMDDDGIPHCDQLASLYKTAKQYSLLYSNALVLNQENKNKMAFGFGNYNEVVELPNKTIIYDELNPFNGTLIHRSIPEQVGFIKKEMFIWGDEVEYTNRVKNAGFEVGTVLDALHFHPPSKSNFDKILSFLPFQVIKKPQNRAGIYYRNLGYTNFKYKKYNFAKLLIKYTIYYLVRLDLDGARLFLRSYLNGAKNKF